MKILIYGGGAVGLGLASCLIKTNNRVEIVARKDTFEALKRDGLRRTGIFGDHYSSSEEFHVVCNIAEITESDFDYIIVSTKSNDTRIAAQDILRTFGKEVSAKIVLMQNGWGNFEIFSEYFDRSKIYNGRVITGFSRPEKNTSKITVHADDIRIGSLSGESAENMAELAKAISDGGLPCIAVKEIEKDLWAKMLYNCALNPVGAIFGVCYGELGLSQHTREIMENIVREIFEVINGYDYKIYWDTYKQYLDMFYSTLLPPTALHESSMLQDIKAKKRTEIDALNGQVILLGEKKGINVSVNKTIYDMIKFIEERE